jgi:hypothetical protein
VAVGEEVELKVGIFGPEIKDQIPVAPPVGVFAANVAVVAPQIVWLGPAFAVIEGMVTLIVTSLWLDAQDPFVIVHLKTYVPLLKPEIADVDEFGLAMVKPAGPLICDHVPVPTVGKFAVKTVAVLHMS